MSPGCKSDATSAMPRFELTRSNSIAGITTNSRKAVSRKSQRHSRHRSSPYKALPLSRIDRGRGHTVYNNQNTATIVPLCNPVGSAESFKSNQSMTTNSKSHSTITDIEKISSSVNEVSKLLQHTLSLERRQPEPGEDTTGAYRQNMKDQEAPDVYAPGTPIVNTALAQNTDTVELCLPANCSRASTQVQRAPLTPCMPNQFPSFQMPSPKTIQNLQNQEQWNHNQIRPKKDILASKSQATVGAEQDRSRKRGSNCEKMRRSERTKELQTQEDSDEESDKETPLVCMPSFFDDFINVFSSHAQIFADVGESMNKENCVPNEELDIPDLRKRDTVILESEDKENNISTADAYFPFEFLDGHLELNQPSLFDSTPEQFESDTYELEKSKILEEILKVLSREQSMEGTVGSALNDQDDDQAPANVSSYRNLLNSPSDFICIVCEANLELLPYQSFGFDFETGEFPGSHLEEGGHQIDLFCPVCCCRRPGYHVSLQNEG